MTISEEQMNDIVSKVPPEVQEKFKDGMPKEEIFKEASKYVDIPDELLDGASGGKWYGAFYCCAGE